MLNKVLIIEDSLSFAAYLSDVLSDSYAVSVAHNASDGLRTALTVQPEIILLDLVLPDVDGYEAFKSIKANKMLSDIPIIFVSAVSEIKDQTRGLELGAVDYIVKPINPDIVRAKIKNHIKIKHDFERLENISLKDPLTMVGNRRLFDERLDAEWRRAKRDGFSLGLFMLDIDFFKNFNDTEGHIAGDKCLKAVAGAISTSLKRGGDIVARYGGEEFAAILPGINLEAAQRVAERIIENVKKLQIRHPDSSVSEFVMLSIGGAIALPCAETEMFDIVKKADVALYSAKKNGRNRIVLAESAF
ncbi:MAG: diguanylate cyclase [Spirochaetes bacterium]|nr:diguanylate cyclase [Spirochaetota bacterium]